MDGLDRPLNIIGRIGRINAWTDWLMPNGRVIRRIGRITDRTDIIIKTSTLVLGVTDLDAFHENLLHTHSLELLERSFSKLAMPGTYIEVLDN